MQAKWHLAFPPETVRGGLLWVLVECPPTVRKKPRFGEALLLEIRNVIG